MTTNTPTMPTIAHEITIHLEVQEEEIIFLSLPPTMKFMALEHRDYPLPWARGSRWACRHIIDIDARRPLCGEWRGTPWYWSSEPYEKDGHRYNREVLRSCLGENPTALSYLAWLHQQGWEIDVRPAIPQGDLCRRCLASGTKRRLFGHHVVAVPTMEGKVVTYNISVPASPILPPPREPVPLP